jgi:hypothetical protein
MHKPALIIGTASCGCTRVARLADATPQGGWGSFRRAMTRRGLVVEEAETVRLIANCPHPHVI